MHYNKNEKLQIVLDYFLASIAQEKSPNILDNVKRDEQHFEIDFYNNRDII